MPRSSGTVSSASDDSAPLLGRHAQDLIACNQKLQELGIDNTIRLPQIVCIGDQSTGKSSLIEALSTVQVPKAIGCCTQCPIAINLSSGAKANSPWSCTVYIEEYYEFNDTLLSKGVTKNNPLGPWQKKAQLNTIRVKETSNKDEVPDIIQAAQATILNPGSHFREFLNGSRKSVDTAIKFSPNVIRLDVSEGNWPNLSFIDLPGVIANTGKVKDKWLIKLIRNLVQQYAAAEKSVNMLTLPMTHDIENSQACAIVQELKAEDHTLAVFTKADLANADQRTQFLKKFTGDDELGFEHGYHFVVLRDVMTPNEARAFEAKVFGKPPWSLLDKKHQSRLGVDALRAYLRCLLFEKTAETLPSNLESIRTRLLEVDSELLTLPVPPNAALLPLQLQQAVTQFENAMKVIFTPDSMSSDKSAKAEWTQSTTKFREKLIKARPTLYLMSRVEQSHLSKLEAKLQATSHATATDAIELSSSDEASCSKPVKAETCNQEKFDPVHRFRLEEIREINEKHYQACVPGEIEVRAVEEMNKLSVEHWDEMLAQFMNANSRLLNKHITKAVAEVFDIYCHLDLFSVIENFVKEYLDRAIQGEWGKAEEICRLEQEKPFTYDVTSLKEKEAKCLEERRQKRVERRLTLLQTEMEVAGTAKSKKRAHENDLEPDPYEIELQMSAKSRAYYEVACTRFVDNICLGILGRLLPTCTVKLVDDLKIHLGLNDHTKHDQIISWMAEDPEREARRQRLIQEKTRLAEGLQYIQNVLGMSTKSSPSKRNRQTEDTEEARPPQTPSKRAKTSHMQDVESSMSQPTPGALAGRVQSMELDENE